MCLLNLHTVIHWRDACRTQREPARGHEASRIQREPGPREEEGGRDLGRDAPSVNQARGRRREGGTWPAVSRPRSAGSHSRCRAGNKSADQTGFRFPVVSDTIRVECTATGT